MAVGLCAVSSGAAQPLQIGRRPLVQIGALDAPEEEVFGRIQDVAIGPRGDLFILDGLARDLRWFDAAGRFRGRAGRSGQGPGELSEPVAVAVDDSGFVHVLDAGNQRIAVFAPTAGALELRREHHVPSSLDLCVAGSRRYLLVPWALGGGRLIHEIDDLGGTIRSFGELDPGGREQRRPAAEARLVRSVLERGSLACDAGSGMIVLLSEVTPGVLAFSLDGAGLWQVELADYHPRSYAPTERGGIVPQPDPTTGTVHTGEAVFFGEAFIYVVLHEGSWTVDRLELRALRRADGKELARQALSSRLVTQRAGRAVGFTQEPYPSVVVYAVR